MSNPIPLESSEVQESGRAIQDAQNNTIITGVSATMVFIQELLKNLKLPKKEVNVAININDSVAYKANVTANKSSTFIEAESSSLSQEQVNYLREVVKLPVSNAPAVADIPLDKDVTITVDNKEVFSLKNGIVDKNILVAQVEQNMENPVFTSQKNITLPVPSQENIQEPVSSFKKTTTQVEQSPEKSISSSKVEVVEDAEIHNLKQVDVSFSNEQKQALESFGLDSQTIGKVEEAFNEKQSNSVPFIIVVNQAVNNSKSKGNTKNNFQGLISNIKNATKDISRKVTSFLSSTRERLFPASERNIKQDLQNMAVVDIASRLLERFGSNPIEGNQVFEGNSFRLEKSDKNLTVSAKDGRGTILSLKEGTLTGSLTQKDVEKFQAVERQMNPGQSRSKQSQMEIG